MPVDATKLAALPRRPKSWGVGARRLRATTQIVFSVASVGLGVVWAATMDSPPAAATPGVCFVLDARVCDIVRAGGHWFARAYTFGLAVLVTLVATAAILNAFFCGWACPIGAAQEAVFAIGRFARRRFRWAHRHLDALRCLVRPLAGPGSSWRALRLALLAATAFGVLNTTVVVIQGRRQPYRDLWWFYDVAFLSSVTLGALTLVSGLVVERPFCRLLCPAGLVIGAAARISPFRVVRTATACSDCAVCAKKCPMGIPVDQMPVVASPDCVMCLVCVGACPTEPALNLALVNSLRLPTSSPTLPDE
ncbi:MAG: 4Fe-4S binding protein [Dehalococcoidia bacterium]|nr:4Fe-4S binding protein [Dehalococcoidia bacterium]